MSPYRTTRTHRNNLSDLLRLMLPKLPGCSKQYARMTLHGKLEEFCRDTFAMAVQFPTVDVAVGVTEYRMSCPIDAHAVHVNSVMRKSGATDYIEADPSTYQIDIGDSDFVLLTLNHSPTVAESDGIYIVCPVVPFDRCEEFPDGFLDRWGNVIVAGALAELQADGSKPWANPGMAQYHQSNYIRGYQKANVVRICGGRPGDLTTLNEFARVLL